jgi:hypothetical protein
VATASLQRRDGRSGGDMGRGKEEWPKEGVALRQWGSTGPGAAVLGGRYTRREQGSEAERGVQYEGEKRGSGEADRWDRLETGPRLSVKEREREKSMTGGPGSIKSNLNYVKLIQT